MYSPPFGPHARIGVIGSSPAVAKLQIRKAFS
jgi:hypothetical protein